MGGRSRSALDLVRRQAGPERRLRRGTGSGIGVAGHRRLLRLSRRQAAAQGRLWGLFVQPDARGIGLGTSLVAQVLEYASQAVEEVRLTVATANNPARRLYERLGFERYGLEPRALKIGADYHDEALMTLSLRRSIE